MVAGHIICLLIAFAVVAKFAENKILSTLVAAFLVIWLATLWTSSLKRLRILKKQ